MTYRTKELVGALALGASLIVLVWTTIYRILMRFL